MKKNWSNILLILIFIVGLSLLLYPSFADWWNSFHQSRAIASYSEVVADWSYEKLRLAPCRFYGTLKEENLVIMAHNYNYHFGTLSRLQPGDEVVFVDMDNVTTVYGVTATDVVSPSALEEVTAGDFDLTLFTCTYGGQTRIVVYCDMVEQ